jgi:protoheme IX farnesyltransferase
MVNNLNIKSTTIDLFWLTKPKVMTLLLFTAFGGSVFAAKGLPEMLVLGSVILGGIFASGGAAAINQAVEEDIDGSMIRTRQRPVASGRITKFQAIIFGVILNLLAFIVLLFGSNMIAAVAAMTGSIFYVFIYTLWLKKSTMQNIVIGGAAGAMPPIVGWTAVTGTLDLPAIYLFAIIFFWTPPHFWALALLIKDDYERAKIPMMPVVVGETATAYSIFLYIIILGLINILFYMSSSVLGIIFLTGSSVLGLMFGTYSLLLIRKNQRKSALSLYKFSLLYLFLIFLLVMVDGVY